jgi:predicted RNA binding protein YcfA (HicA-like mRNA interferase family)
MPIGFYKDIIAFFKKNGFSYLRNSKGSYEVWGNSDGLSMIIPKNTKSRHTADKIMQAAGINHKF